MNTVVLCMLFYNWNFKIQVINKKIYNDRVHDME